MRPRVRRCVAVLGTGCFLPALVLAAEGLAAQEDPRFLLDTVQVVGSRAGLVLPAAVRHVVVLDRRQIDRLPARGVSDLLRWAAGVELLTRSPASADLSIRGSGFEEVLVLVDGVRVSDAQTGHFDLDLTLPLERVERVEILRGPASALYGSDAVGGVVNVVTRAPGRGWSGRVEGGSFGAAGAAAAFEGGDRVRGHLALEWNRSDGHRRGTDHDVRIVHGGGRLPLAGGELRADGGVALRDFGAHRFYADNPDWDEFEETRTYTLALEWQGPAGAGTRWEARTAMRRHDDTFVLFRTNPAVYQNTHVGYQVDAEVGARRLAGGLEWAAGGSVGADLLDSNNLGARQEARGALFAEAVRPGAGGVTAQVGLRADVHERWGTAVSPSLALSRPLADGLRARASLGRSFRGPTFTERFYEDPANIGSPDLDPERSWSADVGLDWLPGGGQTRISATGWLRESKDLIDWARPAGEGSAPWRTRNVDRASFRGLDLEGAGALASVGWTLGLSLVELETGEEAGYSSKSTLRPTVRSLRGGVHHRVGPLELGVLLDRSARRHEEGHTRADLRASARPLPGWVVRVDLTNVGDAAIPDLTGIPGPGRALVVGLGWEGLR